MPEQSKNFVTMKEFVEIAIDFEEASAAFYRNLMTHALDEKSIEVLGTLEKQEIEHADSLRGFGFDKLAGERLQFAPELTLSMPNAPDSESLADLFEIAVNREKKSVRIYEFTSDLVAGKFKDLLLSLAEFERAHLRYLQLIKRKYKD